MTGIVTDTQGTPMAFANVVVLSAKDSAYIKGTATKADGSFLFEGDYEGNILRISSLGYQPVITAAKAGDMGTFQMAEETSMLGEVVVKANIPRARLKDGALVMDVENTVLSKMGNGDDVLTHVPLVVKSQDGYEIVGKARPSYT